MSDLIVPLMIDSVIIGKVTIDDHNHFSAEITAPSTPSYLKEMMLVNPVQGISMNIDYVEPQVPTSKGHLHIVR